MTKRGSRGLPHGGNNDNSTERFLCVDSSHAYPSRNMAMYVLISVYVDWRIHTMKLAVIAPPEYLNEIHYARLSYHMALGQELIRNVAYCDWYRWRHNRGDFIIVDNGAAEPGDERIPFEAVLDAAEYVHADEVIMPDVLYNGYSTIALTTDPGVLTNVPVRSRMIVPQGTCFEEWVECYEGIAEKIQFRSIGVAKHLEKTAQGGRAAIIRWLHNQRWTEVVDIHLLGIWEDPIAEIRRTSDAWCGIRGIDSGAPIAYAQQGLSIDSAGHYSLDWVADASRTIIKENIKTLLNECARGEIQHASQSI